MPTLSNAFGSSNVATVTTPTMSLHTTKMTVTPTDTSAEQFFPFTDIQFSPADQSSREVATCHVPATLHLLPPQKNAKGNRAKGVSLSRESLPWLRSDVNIDSDADKNAVIGRMFGSDMVNFLWGKDHLGRDSKTKFKQFTSEEEAVKWIGESAVLTNIAYMITPRTVKFFFHDSMIRQIVARLRELVEDLGSMTPSVCFMGLGHTKPSTQAPRNKKKQNADNAAEAKIVRPNRLWSAGTLGWNNGKYKANGSIYIPMDYLPYSTLKRAAKYNHIINQIGYEWAETLRAVGADWATNGKDLEVMSNGYRTTKSEMAMLNLLFGSMPAMGFTDNLSPTDSPLDDNSIITGMKGYLTFPFTSAHTHLDLGILGSVAKYMKDGKISGAKDAPKPWNAGPLGQRSPRACFEQFLRHHFIMSIVLSAFEGKYKVPLYPAVFMYEGGPRPEHVQQRMMMNFRPDRDYGGSNDVSQFTLIPQRLAPGEILTRVPTYMHTAAESPSLDPNVYLGPRDPVVISDVKTSTYFGDKAETVIDDEFYYASPVIQRDGTIQTTYRNYRHVNSATVQRPPFFTPNASILGCLLGMMSHHSPVSGPVYEQVLLKPYYNVKDGEERRVHFNNQYDSATTTDPQTFQVIDGQSFAQQRRRMRESAKSAVADKDNPQNVDPVDGKTKTSTDIIMY